MVLYFVEFVEFAFGYDRLATQAVRAPADATEKDILQALWDMHYTGAHTIMMYDIWENIH
tara:strand:+ start:340 stop:519 length:180 start_codon:yes stop_codon:yes gene_type:complete